MKPTLCSVLLGIILAQLWAAPARASDAGWGTITTFEVFANGVVLVTTNGSRDTPPACQSTRPDLVGRWGLDASTPGGQALLAILATANAQRRRIRITGTAACQTYYDSENIAYVQVEPQ